MQSEPAVGTVGNLWCQRLLLCLMIEVRMDGMAYWESEKITLNSRLRAAGGGLDGRSAGGLYSW